MGKSPLISSSTGGVIPLAWLGEAGGSVPTLKISHVHWAQASTLPPSWESGKLIPPMVGMGEEAAGKVKSGVRWVRVSRESHRGQP